MIDWGEVARRLESVQVDGSEVGGDHLARKCLALVLGEDELRCAVDQYLELGVGNEVIRSTLSLLQPECAMLRCFEVVEDKSEDLDRRMVALSLLSSIADAHALEWIPGFLNDPNEDIQAKAMYVLEQIIYRERIGRNAVEDILDVARAHPSPCVRESVTTILDTIKNIEM